MTEAEWLASADPEALLTHLRNKVIRTKSGRRRLRLLACGGCRMASHYLLDEKSYKSLEVAERFADDKATLEQLGKAFTAARKAHYRANTACAPRFAKAPRHITHPNYHLTGAVVNASWAKDVYTQSFAIAQTLGQAARESVAYQEGEPIGEFRARGEAARDAMFLTYARLVREVFGNPFSPVTLDRAWQTSNVTALAQAIYADRAFDRMPILADALEDAGCTSREVLDHCRGPGPHVRGCWVVDLLLGKT